MKRMFVYKTTDTRNGNYYIGQHNGYVDDNYYGSGNFILSLTKYEVENYLTREILGYAENKKQLDLLESVYIRTNYDDNKCQNVAKGKRLNEINVSIDNNWSNSIKTSYVNSSSYSLEKRLSELESRINKIEASKVVPKESNESFLLNSLSDNFTRQDVNDVYDDNNRPSDKTISNKLKSLINSGHIYRISNGVYKKNRTPVLSRRLQSMLYEE